MFKRTQPYLSCALVFEEVIPFSGSHYIMYMAPIETMSNQYFTSLHLTPYAVRKAISLTFYSMNQFFFKLTVNKENTNDSSFCKC